MLHTLLLLLLASCIACWTYDTAQINIYAGGGNGAASNVLATSVNLPGPMRPEVDIRNNQIYVPELNGHRVRAIDR
jgi:hypothetical protein